MNDKTSLEKSKIVCPFCYPFGVSFVVPKCPSCGKEAPEHIKKQEGWV